MSEPPQNSAKGPFANRDSSPANLALLAALTVFAFLIMGYHPGLEDDAFYLAAIKRNLNPALFPHDAEFFRLQFQATIFDKLIAFSVRLSHLPLAWIVLLWQLAAIFLLLHGCWRISRRCFAEPAAQWAAVTMIAVLLTLPLPGIAISLADQYLHPRTLATAAILAAIVAVIDRRFWMAGTLLAAAFAVHAIMASFGISFCAFLFWNRRASSRRSSLPLPFVATLALPLGWVFEPASDAWRQAAATRGFYFPTHWHWYEWESWRRRLLFTSTKYLQSANHQSEKAEKYCHRWFRRFFIMECFKPPSVSSSCCLAAWSVCAPSSPCAICTCSTCCSS
jgi:hypothetical protein